MKKNQGLLLTICRLHISVTKKEKIATRWQRYKMQHFRTSCCTFQKDRRKNLSRTWQLFYFLKTDLSLEQVLKVVVGAGGGIAPVLGPPDGQQEQVHSVRQQPVVVSNKQTKLTIVSGYIGRRWHRPNAGTTRWSAGTDTQGTSAARSCQQLANKTDYSKWLYWQVMVSPPVLGPPDGQQEQVHCVRQQPVVVSN